MSWSIFKFTFAEMITLCLQKLKDSYISKHLLYFKTFGKKVQRYVHMGTWKDSKKFHNINKVKTRHKTHSGFTSWVYNTCFSFASFLCILMYIFWYLFLVPRERLHLTCFMPYANKTSHIFPWLVGTPSLKLIGLSLRKKCPYSELFWYVLVKIAYTGKENKH